MPHGSPYSPQTYVEALAEADPLDTPDIVEPVHIDKPGPGR
jgi:hypothetical protein